MKKIVKLKEVPTGGQFEIGNGIRLFKLGEKDGRAMVVFCEPLLQNHFGVDSDYRHSAINSRLVVEILPMIERLIGAENLLEFTLNLLTVDGSRRYGTHKCRIAVPTHDIYRVGRDIFDRYPVGVGWWLATADTVTTTLIDSRFVAPSGREGFIRCGFEGNWIRPMCVFNSNIDVSLEEEENAQNI